MKKFLLTALFTFIGSLVFSQERIAVFPFEDMDKIFTGNESFMFYRQFSNEFTNRNAGRFRVVPRQDVERLINTEAAFQLSDFSANAKTAEMQRVLNGTRILSGAIGKVGNRITISVSLYTYPELEQLPGGVDLPVANKVELFDKIPELVQRMHNAITGGATTNDTTIVPTNFVRVEGGTFQMGSTSDSNNIVDIFCRKWRVINSNKAENIGVFFTFTDDGAYLITNINGVESVNKWRWHNEHKEFEYTHDNWRSYGRVTIHKLDRNSLIMNDPGFLSTVNGYSTAGNDTMYEMVPTDIMNKVSSVHMVTISSFFLGKYEVTQKEWFDTMRTNPSYFKGDNLPVENVSWFDAVDYCNKLSQKEGLTPTYTINGSGDSRTVTWNRNTNGYRLPTEAEWEYAARGGNGTPGNYAYAGSNNADEVAWLSVNTGSKTQNVGTKKANGLGIYDMSGNVWEWCWDWFGDYSNVTQIDPVGTSSGVGRVLRGGSWADPSLYARSTHRYGVDPLVRYSGIGFRVVRNAK